MFAAWFVNLRMSPLKIQSAAVAPRSSYNLMEYTMKTILLGVVAALALTSLPAVHAQDASVSVNAARTTQYQMQPDEFSPYRNTYKLENGQKISFDNEQNRLYAKLDAGRPVRIYATSKTSFVTEDGTRFDFHEDGEGLAISDFQKMRWASTTPASKVMMARR
jgi:hypothetical protein